MMTNLFKVFRNLGRIPYLITTINIVRSNSLNACTKILEYLIAGKVGGQKILRHKQNLTVSNCSKYTIIRLMDLALKPAPKLPSLIPCQLILLYGM